MSPPPPPPSYAVVSPWLGTLSKDPPKPCPCTKCVPDGQTCGSGAEESGLCRYCKDNCKKHVHFTSDTKEN